MKQVTIQLKLPDDFVRRAETVGLLTPEAIEAILEEEFRRRAWDDLLAIAGRSRELDLPPLTQEEVQAEIDADRAEQRRGRRG